VSVSLELVGVRRSFHDGTRDVAVLDGVDLRLLPGELVALVGRSGSGKTTLFQVAAGFEPPDAGEVRWPVSRGGTPPWTELAVVPQSLGLLDELTIEENVALPGRLAGGADPDAVAAALADVGVAHLRGRLPGEASLGEQQRAAVARAVVARPAVLLADEPVSHQNDAFAAAVLGTLTRAAEGGAAVLVASHDPAVVAVASRVLELREGRLGDVTAAAVR